MKVLFLMIVYPDVGCSTNMYTDLASEFNLNGHDVYVAAPDKEKTKLRIEGDIKVLRIKTLPLFNTSFIYKGIANVLLPFQYKFAIKKYLKDIKFDLVITPTPPITFLQTLKFLRRKYNSKIYLILRDIFPQNALDLGLIKNRFIFGYFRRQEKKLYKLSDSIGCMSQKNIDFVRTHNPEVNTKKLHILANWSTVNYNFEKQKVKRNNDLSGKFVAVFGGNFGVPQKIEFIIDVAERLNHTNNFIFLLIGDGTEKSRIQNLILKKELTNVLIYNHLPREKYFQLLECCDVGLVNLSDKFTIPNIPSRTLAYWSLKIPVLAAIDRNTDYNELLEKSGGGFWSYTGDIDSYIDNLFYLFQNPEKRKEMGLKGHQYLLQELNTEKAYRIITSNIKEN
jgi:glycosyltransferase involved in cell wall biosynthesis